MFAHDAVVELEPGADPRAPGAAVTVALCGGWEHEPPCPLAPHFTSAEPAGSRLRVRVLFAADPADEAEARARIGAGLRRGALTGPDGRASRWRLVTDSPGDVRADEAEHGARLAGHED
ncbi:hypothetical protein [Kitasatospora sp. NPDC088346]|uniref:hypothetical protein n=1 Tax=Kitasatospora sp. NPDC088346 TaxID=3364073 RepID=UPI0038138442